MCFFDLLLLLLLLLYMLNRDIKCYKIELNIPHIHNLHLTPMSSSDSEEPKINYKISLNPSVISTHSHSAAGSAATTYACNTCKSVFKTKTLCTKHQLYCGTLSAMRTKTTGAPVVIQTVEDDTLLPTQRELFMLLQELTLKHAKLHDEMEELKKWAKRAGTVNQNGVSVPFTISKYKKQNTEEWLNENARLEASNTFVRWYTGIEVSQKDLEVLFSSDLATAMAHIIVEVIKTAVSLDVIPLRSYEGKAGIFHIFELPYKVISYASDGDKVETGQGTGQGQGQGQGQGHGQGQGQGHGQDETYKSDTEEQGQTPLWRTLEEPEFGDFMSNIHKKFMRAFKVWQDTQWSIQKQAHQKKKAAQSIMNKAIKYRNQDHHPQIPDETDDIIPETNYLTEDFTSMYNKNTEKIMGGNLELDVIYKRVRGKIWKAAGKNITVI